MKTDQDSLAREGLGCGTGKSTGGGISACSLFQTRCYTGEPSGACPRRTSDSSPVTRVESGDGRGKPPPLLFFILLHIYVVSVISAAIYWSLCTMHLTWIVALLFLPRLLASIIRTRKHQGTGSKVVTHSCEQQSPTFNPGMAGSWARALNHCANSAQTTW